jgi:hypothetical protein
MAVRIVTDEEELKIEIEGSIFQYKRIPTKERANIVQRHQPKRGQGEPNWDNVMVSMLEYGITGWEKVETPDGEGVPFDPDLVARLPHTVQIELLDVLGANIDKLKAELGN